MAGNVSPQQSLPFLILPSLEVEQECYRGGMSAIYSLRNKPNRVLKLYVLSRGGCEQTGEVQKVGAHLRLRLDNSDLPDYPSYNRELAALEILSHPNIVEAIGQGVVLTNGSAIPYLVLTYFKGKNLNEIIVSGEDLSQKTICSIILQVARGLGYVHKKGLIHKDVKPQNILFDGEHRSILVDFGLAGPLPEQATFEDIVLGTPLYMSPEQAKGEMLDQRVDIYSLGVSFYQAVTKVIPFDEEQSAYELLRRKVNHDIVDPRIFNSRLSSGLAKIILRATERDPRRRYFTMDDLIGDIETFLLKI